MKGKSESGVRDDWKEGERDRERERERGGKGGRSGERDIRGRGKGE